MSKEPATGASPIATNPATDVAFNAATTRTVTRITRRMHPMVLDLLVCLVIPLLIPLGVLFAAAALLSRLGSLWRASDPCARNYWRCSVVAHFLFAYAVLVLSLLAADNLLDQPWAVPSWWPSLARLWVAAEDLQFQLLLEVMAVLMAALIAMMGARYFGFVDELDIWHPPRRLALARRCKAGEMGGGYPDQQEGAGREPER